MAELDLSEIADYERHLRANEKSETRALVSLLTTHHTYFFREFAHFEYLEKEGLAAAVTSAKARGSKTLRLWSAACSHGHEVYSLAMFISRHLPKIAPGFDFKIIGTDVDPESVAIAKNGVYRRRDIKDVPMALLGSFWSRGTGEIADFVRARSSLRANCEFRVSNLLDLARKPKSGDETFDLIFCRNVFIYFTPAEVGSIAKELLSRLSPTGRLFVGISESLSGMGLPVTAVGPSIYAPMPPTESSRSRISDAKQLKEKPLRVLCVDDSPTVLALLKRILTPEHGFVMVGTAGNGLEAAARLRENEVDVMTLDIHMPEQTGLEYLLKSQSSIRPPVVVVSSVSRENADLAVKCLEAGAADYVEKPAMAKFDISADEIRTKLRCAHKYARERSNASNGLLLDRAFSSQPIISMAEKKLRIIGLSLADRLKLRSLLSELRGPQPPTVLLIEGGEAALPAFRGFLSSALEVEVEVLPNASFLLQAGKIYLGDLRTQASILRSDTSRVATSVLVYGSVSPSGLASLSNFDKSYLLLEESQRNGAPSKGVNDIVPDSSFAYMSVDYLARI